MTNSLSYRDFEEKDMQVICSLPQDEEELFFMFPKADYPLTEQQLKTALENRSDPTVILCHGEIAGFVNFYEVVENHYCSIGNVVVDAQYRGQGIGEFLIATMENIAVRKYKVSEFRLSCFNTNTRGILLYSKLGYQPYEIEKRLNKEQASLALIKMKRTLYDA